MKKDHPFGTQAHMHTADMEEKKFNETSRKHYMKGGDGPDSYSRNSEFQKQVLTSAEDLIHQQIDEHLNIQNCRFDPLNTFRIADFGCSIGPNTFYAVENIISAVKNKYEKSNQNQTPDFQVFFNDLIENDFNTLFRNLPSNRTYLVAAAPGSFYDRLFPKKSINFAHCSMALHWVSRIPKEVTERGNNGKIHYLGGEKEVKEPYAAQYEEDFGRFLTARGDELVDGGLMALLAFGFAEGDVYSLSGAGMVFEMLGSCLEDMAKLGKFTKEKVDSFNLPFYFPSESELKALIEATGLFCIEKIAKMASPMSHKPDLKGFTSSLKAVLGVLIEDHFGNGVVEELFGRLLEKVLESPILSDEKYWKDTNYFVFLKRNGVN
ncbi:Loganate O-methyltransferase [Handroanthus impetiginosus]|uniref:Loganate O-methyltransferase n=1 Tax=Handroanthus impetiginosus TaxID=429701 RepID=A0A2G9GSF6_9LAMI|nr:Loganate O-methyltransferase [Handroanthus impetiginosus]